jgi:hypothetical protein
MSDSPLEKKFLRMWKKTYPGLMLIPDKVMPVPNRRFRLDFAHIDSLVGIEIAGGIWGKGAHSSGKGLMRDYEKLNLCQMNGWIVFQLSSQQITPQWCKRIAQTIEGRY